MRPLPIFFESLFDKKFPFAKYPKARLRNFFRPKEPGGQEKMFLNLCKGLTEAKIPYTVNNYRIDNNALVALIGKMHLLNNFRNKKILLGPALYNHPIDHINLLEEFHIPRILVPGPWMQTMCEPYWKDKVYAWPVGIDTCLWNVHSKKKKYDVLIYDKIMWQANSDKRKELNLFINSLQEKRISFVCMRYGSYKEKDFLDALRYSKAMIFLCEHETQGLAYLQALSCNVPILAWDQELYWQDPKYYPSRVKFGPVSSVPYWDERCGMRFREFSELPKWFDLFWNSVIESKYQPRSFIMENLTLQKCAKEYATHYEECCQFL